MAPDGSARRRTRTAADGTFTFGALGAERYTLEVTSARFVTARVDLGVDDANTPPMIRIVLRVAGFNETVDITADTGRGDVEATATSATRTTTPLESIPQSIVTVPRTMVVDQGVRTVSEALRNVSNVSILDPRDVNNAVFKIRGFHSATVVDGVAMPGYFPGRGTGDLQRHVWRTPVGSRQDHDSLTQQNRYRATVVYAQDQIDVPVKTGRFWRPARPNWSARRSSTFRSSPREPRSAMTCGQVSQRDLASGLG